MISISKTTADITNGNVILKELATSDIKSKRARVSRAATLDGGVYISHSGVTDGDRKFTIEADRITPAQEAVLDYMYRTQIFILCSCADGLYLGAIEDFNTKNGKLKLTILIKQKEN